MANVKNKTVSWERHRDYRNVIVVNWREKKMNDQRDEATMRKLCTPLRALTIKVHTQIVKIAEVIFTPVTWVLEQFNGTAEWRDVLVRMEEEEHKVLINKLNAS